MTNKDLIVSSDFTLEIAEDGLGWIAIQADIYSGGFTRTELGKFDSFEHACDSLARHAKTMWDAHRAPENPRYVVCYPYGETMAAAIKRHFGN